MLVFAVFGLVFGVLGIPLAFLQLLRQASVRSDGCAVTRVL